MDDEPPLRDHMRWVLECRVRLGRIPPSRAATSPQTAGRLPRQPTEVRQPTTTRQPTTARQPTTTRQPTTARQPTTTRQPTTASHTAEHSQQTRTTWRTGSESRSSGTDRGQLSLSLIEAAIGVVFVLIVAATFAVALPDPGTTQAQLDVYAADTTTVLANEPPRHGDADRLTEIADAETFEAERNVIDQRMQTLLPATVLYRVTTPGGTLGFDPPAGETIGRHTVAVPSGTVTVEVWYT